MIANQVPVLPFAAPLEPHHQLHAQHPQEQAQLLFNNLQHTAPAAASPEGADVDMANAEALVPPLVIHNPKEPVSSSLWVWLPRARSGEREVQAMMEQGSRRSEGEPAEVGEALVRGVVLAGYDEQQGRLS